MKACQDCRHVNDDDEKAVVCNHDLSFKDLPDFYLGRTRRLPHPIHMMWTIGPCGPNAVLFEPRRGH